MFDRKFLIFVLGIQLLISLSFITGVVLSKRANVAYVGAHLYTPADYPVYLNYIQQVRDGAVFFENFYTSEAFPVIFNPFWFGAGLVSVVTSFSPAVTYHLLRIVFGAGFLYLMMFLGRRLFQTTRARWVMMLMMFAGGVGVFVAPFIEMSRRFIGYYHAPMDLWVPEAFGWLMLGNSPHMIASVILMTLALWWFGLAMEQHSFRFAAASGVMALILFSFHPFHVPLIFGVEGAGIVLWWIVQRRIVMKELGLTSLAILIPIPSVVYHVFLILRYDAIAERASQNLLFTPELWLTATSYGFFGVLGLTGGLLAYRRAKTSFIWMLLLVWLVLQPFFFFGPFDWQRRMTQGWFIPLAIFSVFSLRWLGGVWLKNGWKSARMIEVVFLALILLFFSPIYVWVSDLRYMESNVKNPEHDRSFLLKEDMELLRFLRKNAGKNDVILADFLLSNLIPGLTGHRVYVGHGVETLNFYSKFWQMETFYNGKTPIPVMKRFLGAGKIALVVFDTSKNTSHPLLQEQENIVFKNDRFTVLKF